MRLEMYNGYDWYGRIIEVREVLFFSRCEGPLLTLFIELRTVTLVFRVDVGVDVDEALTVASVVAEEDTVDAGDTVACRMQTCMLIILVRTNKWVRELG